MKKKYVIIGGDAAGMSAASRAKRNNPETEVIVLEKTHDVSYSACNMPYNIADTEREIDDLVVRKAEVFKNKQGIRLLTGHLVEKIDPAAKTVSGVYEHGKHFELTYDKLLIASGGSPVIPNIPGFLAQIGVTDATGFVVNLYNYAWFLGLGIAGIAYYLLMGGREKRGQRTIYKAEL